MIAEDIQRRLVDAEQARAVERVGDDAAFHGGEDSFHGVVLLDDLILVGALLGDVDADADGAHDRPVDVVEGRLVRGEQARAVAGLHGLFRDDGRFDGHNLALGFDAGGIVGLYVPDIGVTAALNLLLGFVHGGAEGVVDLMVDAVFGFVPHQRGDGVDRGLEVLAGLPGIGVALAGTLPVVEAPGCLGGAQRRDPQVGDVVEVGLDGGHLVVGDDEGDRCGGLPVSGEDAGPGGGIVARGIGENGAGLGGERLFGLIAAREMVRKAWLRLRIFDNACDLVGQAHEIESHRAMVHGARPLELLNVSLP